MNTKLSSTLPKFALAAVVFAFAGSAQATTASHASSDNATSHEVAGGWEKLGERAVNGRNDHDVISVGKRDGRFTAIEIRVDGNPIEMFDIVVVFGDGQKFEPKTRLIFDKNTRSRAIDLPGDKRVIERVDFHYGKVEREGHAAVELWGKSA